MMPQKRRPTTFPATLYDMLSKMEEDGTEHVISWSSDDRSFKVHDEDEFVKSVMPKYFRMTLFASFHRQLNLYSFVRIMGGVNKGSFYHEHFRRDKPDELKLVSRSMHCSQVRKVAVDKKSITGSASLIDSCGSSGQSASENHVVLAPSYLSLDKVTSEISFNDHVATPTISKMLPYETKRRDVSQLVSSYDRSYYEEQQRRQSLETNKRLAARLSCTSLFNEVAPKWETRGADMIDSYSREDSNLSNAFELYKQRLSQYQGNYANFTYDNTVPEPDLFLFDDPVAAVGVQDPSSRKYLVVPSNIRHVQMKMRNYTV